MATKRTRNPERTMLLICCTREEAERIRTAAKRERRSISAFVINAVMNRFTLEGRLQERRELQRVGQARRTNVGVDSQGADLK